MAGIKSRLLHTFPASMQFLPKDALRYGAPGARRLLCVGQQGLNEQDESAWAHDEGGHWLGPAPIRAVPSDVRAVGATTELVGADTINRLPSGSAPLFSWGLRTEGQVEGSGNSFRAVLQDVGTGATIFDELTSSQFQAGALPDGTYLIAVRLSLGVVKFRLPEGYTRNNPRFQWGPGLEDYWDWEKNLGRMAPPAHAFYTLRSELLKANKQQDNPLWADYIVSYEGAGGEWSSRLLVVGAGALTVPPGYIPPWGASLYHITSPTARTALPIDALARTADKLKITATGALMLAGQRSTPNGIVTALWRSEDGDEWELLGTNENPSNGVCECALANHGPTEILERPDGVIKVLTKCSKHRYKPTGPSILSRLPGDPVSTDGHPGGQSLRYWNGREWHTTENFGETNFITPLGIEREQFYDVLIVESSEGMERGPGTAFHGRDDMALWNGKLWAVIQDKATTAPGALQFITWFEGSDWSFDTTLQYPASAYQWQRVIGYESGEESLLVAFGKRTNTEERLMGVGDGRQFTHGVYPYAVRGTSISEPEDTLPATARRVLISQARTATPEAIGEDWLLVETTAQGTKVIVVCEDELCECLCGDADYLAGLGIEPSELPLVIVWNGVEWRPATTVPTDGRPYKELSVEDGVFCYCGEGGPETGECNGLEFDMLTGTIRRVTVDPETLEVLGYCDGLPMPPEDAGVIVLHYPGSLEAPIVSVIATEQGRPHLLRDFNAIYSATWVRVNKEHLPPSDLSTYDYALPWEMLQVLPEPATESVEVLFYTPPGMGMDELIPAFLCKK